MTPVAKRQVRIDGLIPIVTAVQFSAAFSLLSSAFDYPAILRRPAAEILTRFHAGGPDLVLVWYLFALAPLGLIPVALMVRRRLQAADGQSHDISAAFAVVGAVFQALGLIRWVFAVPTLARLYADPAQSPGAHEASRVAFMAFHQYAGVAVGEDLGQICMAIWMGLTAVSQARNGSWLSLPAFAAAALIMSGLPEHFSTVIPFDPGLATGATPLGYLFLSVWMLGYGVIELLGLPRASRAAT